MLLMDFIPFFSLCYVDGLTALAGAKESEDTMELKSSSLFLTLLANPQNVINKCRDKHTFFFVLNL